MVVVSAIVGVVLAVASVPVGAILLNFGPLAQPIRSRSGVGVDGEFAVILTSSTYRTGTVWFANRPETFVAAEVPDIIATGALESAAELPRPALLDHVSGIEGARMWMLRAGWPMDAASAYEVVAPPSTATRMVGGLELNTANGSVMVPYLPHVPGFLANNLFYATIAFAALAGVRLLRTWRRGATGRCVACGYELGDGVGVCPECGLAMSPRS